MDINEVKRIAREKMNEHGLGHWVFELDAANIRFGVCKHTKQTISLSRSLCLLNSEAHVMDVILHEIAHALLGIGHGHSNTWKAKAREIGCNATRCYGDEVLTVDKKFIGTCPICGQSWKRNRRMKRGYHKPCNVDRVEKVYVVWKRNKANRFDF